jgi:toxin-antitoxin system PIN domain toxin
VTEPVGRRSLLDVNVLLALLDVDHVDHERLSAWLSKELSGGWASCPLTENGFVRIVSSPTYPGPVTPERAVRLLAEACRATDHVFWSDDLSLLDPSHVDTSRLHGHRQVTDAYLLALAVHHDGRLITNDRRIARVAVPRATDAHLTVAL